jgi:hypothetical protein
MGQMLRLRGAGGWFQGEKPAGCWGGGGVLGGAPPQLLPW